MRKFLFNKALRILLITNGMVLISGAMLIPIYALFVEEIGGSLMDASLTGGIFALVAGITTLFAGRFADRIKRDELIVAYGYAISGIGFMLYNFVDSIWFLFAVQALVGFAEAFYSPAFDKLYTKHVTMKKAGREWGVWESLNYFSIAIGAIVGGLIVTAFSFKLLFMIMAVLCCLSAIYIWRLPKRVL
jgi:MFS family permease